MQLFQTCIIWTRSLVLVFSVFIVILSLSIYNCNAIPVFTLLESDRSILLQRGHGIIYDMIQDRRLIATLVAAQASILCPLFLLLGAAPPMHHLPLDIEEEEYNVKYKQLKRMDLWRTIIEQLCQFLMPVGLALSWLFCILFDRKTEAALYSQNLSTIMVMDNDRCGLALRLVTILKYVVVGLLLTEVLVIWCLTFRSASILMDDKKEKKDGGVIKLNEEDEKYTVYLNQIVEKV